MKISTFIGILVVVGAIFFVFAQMVGEANQQYGTSIDTGKWNSSYDYSSRVSSATAPLQDSFNQITDENNGWFTKLTAGITAIPRAVISLPVLVFSAFSIGGSMITGFFAAFGLPTYILTVCLLLLTVWGIFKLVETFQRWQV